MRLLLQFLRHYCGFSSSTRYQRNFQQPKYQWNLWHGDNIRLIKSKHIKITTSYFLIFTNEFPEFSVRRQNCVGNPMFRVDIKQILMSRFSKVAFRSIDIRSCFNGKWFPFSAQLRNNIAEGNGIRINESESRKKSYSFVNMQELSLNSTTDNRNQCLNSITHE